MAHCNCIVTLYKPGPSARSGSPRQRASDFPKGAAITETCGASASSETGAPVGSQKHGENIQIKNPSGSSVDPSMFLILESGSYSGFIYLNIQHDSLQRHANTTRQVEKVEVVPFPQENGLTKANSSKRHSLVSRQLINCGHGNL